MANNARVYTLLIILLSFFSLHAQKSSSKSKAANKVYEKGGEIEVINAANINTPRLEFSPAYYQNGIVFAATAANPKEKDSKTNEGYFQLYYAEFGADGLPMQPRPFSLRINSRTHEGPVTFSRDGKTMYFTRSRTTKNKGKTNSRGQNVLQIYEATRGQTDWQNVRELSFIDHEHSFFHPTLSADGQYLYFVSNIPGGFGGHDLYVVEKTSKGWGTPKNLGPEINSPNNEGFPFIHSSGNLIFASEGHEGVGGYDLFMVDMTDRQNKVTSLGEPFNSPADDLGLILSPDGKEGYFASDRAGGKGKDDIYFFKTDNGIWGRTAPLNVTTLLKVRDEINNNVIESAEVRIFLPDDDEMRLYENIILPDDNQEGLTFRQVRKELEQLKSADELTNARGEINLNLLGEQNYLLLISKDGYYSQEVTFNTTGNLALPELMINLKRKTCGEIRGILREAETNNRISSGAIRIISSCGEEEIIMADDRGEFSYCLPQNCDYVLRGVKEDYDPVEEKVDAGQLTTIDPVSIELVLRRKTVETAPIIKAGTVIVLNNIYYDLNKSDIRSGGEEDLNALAGIMAKYPSMSIELQAHTDSRGSKRYNQKLSQRRADAAKSYLVSHGIEADRVKSIGLGESQLRNHCSDGSKCSEEEHQYNRRTEIRILEIDEAVKIRYQE